MRFQIDGGWGCQGGRQLTFSLCLSRAAEVEGEEVEEGRRLYALLRQQLAELRRATLQLRACLGPSLQPFSSQLAAPAAAGGWLLPPLQVCHFLAAEAADFASLQFNSPGESSFDAAAIDAELLWRSVLCR